MQNMMNSQNVDGFFQLNYLPAVEEEAAEYSPAEEKVLGFLADMILRLRTPKAKAIRFCAALLLVSVLLVSTVLAGLNHEIGFLQAALRMAGTVVFGYVATRRCD